MKDLKEIFSTLAQFAKEDPREFVGTIFTLLLIFAFLYFSLWTVHILQG